MDLVWSVSGTISFLVYIVSVFATFYLFFFFLTQIFNVSLSLFCQQHFPLFHWSSLFAFFGCVSMLRWDLRWDAACCASSDLSWTISAVITITSSIVFPFFVITNFPI